MSSATSVTVTVVKTSASQPVYGCRLSSSGRTSACYSVLVDGREVAQLQNVGGVGRGCPARWEATEIVSGRWRTLVYGRTFRKIKAWLQTNPERVAAAVARVSTGAPAGLPPVL